MKQQNVVMNELLSPEAEIQALKEELKKKDELIRRETEKRRARSIAYMDNLGALAMLENKLKSCEAQCDALKASHLLELTQVEKTWEKKVEVLQEENTALKETANRLTSEKAKLKDKARQKDAFTQSVWKQKNADSKASLSSWCSPTVLEKKLKSCEAQCDALKASHLLELTQVEKTCAKKVEVLQEENTALKETANWLTSEKAKLKDKARQKDAFMRSLWKQKNANSNAFLSSVCALIVTEKERMSCEARCDALKAHHLLELAQVEESWGKKVEDVTAENVAVEDTVTLTSKEQPELTQKDSEPQLEMETVKEEDKPEVTESKPHEEKKKKKKPGKKWWKKLFTD